MRSLRHGVSPHPCAGSGPLIRGVGLACGVLSVLGLAAWFPPARALALQPGRGKTQASSSRQSGFTFEYSRSGLNFGNVVVGGVVTQPVTITNKGTSPSTLSAYQVSGNAFSVIGLALPATLGSGQSLSFTARFAPSAAGTFIGRVIVEEPGSQKHTILLQGTGDVSTFTLSLSTASIDFGNVVVGGDAQLPVVVQNRGPGSVTISGVSVTGTGYTISNLNPPVTLNADQSTSFTVMFAPTATGVSEGRATLTTNADNLPETISFTGTGLIQNAHYVRLNWTKSTSPGVIEYDIYRGTVSGGPYSEIATVSGIRTRYIDQSVSAGQTYYYVAIAVTRTQQSGYSNEAMAQVP